MTMQGSLVKDGNTTSVQVGSSFTTSDGTGTPITSPKTYTTGVVTLVVPDNAVELIISPTTDVKVSEVSDLSTYDVVTANSKESIPCARMTSIYIQRVSSNGTFYFRFTQV